MRRSNPARMKAELVRPGQKIQDMKNSGDREEIEKGISPVRSTARPPRGRPSSAKPLKSFSSQGGKKKSP